MARSAKSRVSVGGSFSLALVLSSGTTMIVGLAIWNDGFSIARCASWASLWTFTVLVPTLNALTIHRSIRDLPGTDATEPLHELARLRALLPLFGNMALLSAFALIYGR